jgi:uncharacterized protein (TIGR03437 family)
VQVLVNGRPAPLYYVSSSQVAAIVPYETTAAVAQVQVVYNQTPSNVVTEIVNATTPGVFTIPAGGIGYSAAEHVDGSLVTPTHPAQPGETIAVFVTGLGDVLPSIADGAPGVAGATTNTITALVSGQAATVAYAGLAPTLVALYQVNVTIPTTGLTAGDNYLDLSGPDSYTTEALISIGTGSTTTLEGAVQTNAVQRRRAGKAFRAFRRSPAVAPLK